MDKEGNFINPNTNKKFMTGDRFNGMVYYYKRSKDNKPYFCCEESFLRMQSASLQRGSGKTRTEGGVATRLVVNAKQRCQKYGGKVSITQVKVKKAILENKCQVTGLPFQLFGKERTKNPYSPSLDRKNNDDRNYSDENTQVVLHAVNIAKNEWEEKDLKVIIPAYARALTERREMSTQTD